LYWIVTKRGISHEGKKIGRQSSIVGCWKTHLGLGERKQQNPRTECIMKSFMTRNTHHDQIKEDKMGGTCNSHRGEKKCIQGFGKENRWKENTRKT